MTEAETDRAMAKRLGRPALIIAFVVLALAVVHVVSFMILVNLSLMFTGYFVVGLAFIGGVILVLIGSAVNVSRCRSTWRAHVLALTILAGVFCFYFFVGSLGGPLRIRTSLVLAFTGGQDELHAWAMNLLAEPREQGEDETLSYEVARSDWPRQVRWLRPSKVSIEPGFRDGQECVVLRYALPHDPPAIVIGPRGAVPPDEPIGSDWCEFDDGILYWSGSM